MSPVKPRRLTWDEIRARAEEFREMYVHPAEKIPVPIEEIVEFELNITPWPIPELLKSIDMDGFLSKDLKNIFVDNDIYMDPRWENRLRFTFAHETGHYVLHKEEIKECEFRTAEDWIQFREDMSEDDLFWFEQQAYEFAGRLLVPKQRLIEELENNRDKITQFKALSDPGNDEILIQAISRVICSKFRVSEGVIFRRIRNEKIWQKLNL